MAAVLVAHGSTDPHAAATTRALVRAVTAARPGLEVWAAYLDHTAPRPGQVLAAMSRSGHRSAVVVPLLLTAAYHDRVDLPAALAAARADGLALPVRMTDVLGPVRGVVPAPLLAGLCRRLAEAAPATAYPEPHRLRPPGRTRGVVPGHRGSPVAVAPNGSPDVAVALSDSPAVAVAPNGSPDVAVAPDGSLAVAVAPDGSPAVAAAPLAGSLRDRLAARPYDAVVLAAAGTRDPAALATVEEVAAALGDLLRVPCRAAYAAAAAAAPSVGESVAALRASGARRVGVAAYFLATGRLYQAAARSARSAGAVAVAEPLGAAPELTQLVLVRLDTPPHTDPIGKEAMEIG